MIKDVDDILHPIMQEYETRMNGDNVELEYKYDEVKGDYDRIDQSIINDEETIERMIEEHQNNIAMLKDQIANTKKQQY